VDEIESGRAKMIPGEEIEKWFSKRLRNVKR